MAATRHSVARIMVRVEVSREWLAVVRQLDADGEVARTCIHLLEAQRQVRGKHPHALRYVEVRKAQADQQRL